MRRRTAGRRLPGGVAACLLLAAVPALAVPVKLRAAAHPDYSRIVFDWPRKVAYKTEVTANRVSITFAEPIEANPGSVITGLSAILAGARIRPDGKGIDFDLKRPVTVNGFYSGNAIALDLKPQASPPATTPSPAMPPEVKPPEVKPAEPKPADPKAGDGKAATDGANPATATAGPAPSDPNAAAGDAPTIVFDAGGPASIAVFPRSGRLYIAFDRPLPIGAGKLVGSGAAALGAIEPVPATGGAVFRTKVGPFVWPKVLRSGTTWTITPSTRLATPRDDGIRIDPDPEFLLGARLILRTPDAAGTVQFVDPEVGDRLFAVPLPNPGVAIVNDHMYPEVELMPAFQGAVIRAISDDVTVRPVREGIEISAAGGLHLSPPADRALAGADGASPPAPQRPVASRPADQPSARGPAAPLPGRRIFQINDWQRGGLEHFTDNRQSLQQAIADSPEDLRPKAALDLVRFYLSFGMGQEASGVLQVLDDGKGDLSGWPDYRALRGLARYFSGDLAGADQDLSIPALASAADVGVWRAAIAADRKDWPAAAAGFKAGATILAGYPEPLASRLSLQAAEAALRTNDGETAQRIVDRIVSRGGPDAEAQPAVQYLRGELFQAGDDPDHAREQYKAAYDGPDRYYRTRAGLAQVNLELANNLISPASAISTLQGLTYLWRGDDLEIDVRKRLGEVQIAAGNYADGFNTLKETVAILGDTPQAEQITQNMQQAFAGLFKDGGSKLSTLEAVKLYDDFRELTPLGEQGDELIRNLAERLVKIDLLDRAADLYDHQVKYRLSGIDKARIGTRLAAIRLLDGKADDAIAALEASNVPGIPDDLSRERNTMYAKAMAMQGHVDEALQLLSKDDSRAADLLRIDLAWRSQKWTEAAIALAKVIGPPPADNKPLAPQTSQLVLNRAVALALAGDATGLGMLRRDFGASMIAGPDADTFRVLTRPEQATGLIDVNTIRSRVAEVDVFKNFLKDYQAGKSKADAPEGTAPAGAPPAGAPAPATKG